MKSYVWPICIDYNNRFISLLYLVYFSFRSLGSEPLIKYFQNREAERFSIEEIDKDESDDADLESISRVK